MAVCDNQCSPTVVPIIAPASAATAYSHVSLEGTCPTYIAPTSPTAEFANMKGAERAAVCLGEAQFSAMRSGARKTPPPTPVSPDTNPTAAPTAIAPHKGVNRPGSPSRGLRMTKK